MHADPRVPPAIWVTSIAKIMVGDIHCKWASWFRAHYWYNRIPGDTDFLVKWKVQHTARCEEVSDQLRADGYSVYLEDQNHFEFMRHGLKIGGKPDIVAVKDERALVVECKTGQEREYNKVQTLLYMAILGSTHPECQGKLVEGLLKYNAYDCPFPRSEVDQEFKSRVSNILGQLSDSAAPARTPSALECSRCDISRDDCPERIESQAILGELEIDPFAV